MTARCGPCAPASQCLFSRTRPVTRTVVYEHPLNERIRTLLRLEHLFRRLEAALAHQDAWASRRALEAMVDLVELLSRPELRAELIKELERQQAVLARLLNAPGVDAVRLDNVLARLEAARASLHGESGLLGQSVREQELVSAIAQRASVVGGACDFELPLLHHWLQQPAGDRHALLSAWTRELQTGPHAAGLILDILRGSGEPAECTATDGFYQQALDSNVPYQLLRVAVPASLPCYAEISAGRHRLTIRFMQPRPTERALQVDEDIQFRLTCCAL